MGEAAVSLIRARDRGLEDNPSLFAYQRTARTLLLCLATAWLFAPAGFYVSARFSGRSPVHANPGTHLRTGFQSPFRDLAASFRRPARTVPAETDGEEDPEGRGDWFLFQRIYPFSAIPADARRRAWEAQRELAVAETVSPEASSIWRPIGPTPTLSAWYSAWGLTSGRVNSIGVSPANPRIVVIGSATGGIWRSTDGGDTFIPVSDDQVDLAVGSLVFSSTNPSIVYAGMGDTKVGYLGSGVLKSTDEGVTWSRASNSSLPSPGSTSKIEIDPANSNRLYAAQYSALSGSKAAASGVFVSTDGGVNWTRTLAGAPRDLVIDPSSSRIIYAGLSRIDSTDPPFGLYRSTDSGATWTNLFTAEFELTRRRDIRIAIGRGNPQRLYAYYGGFIGATPEAHLKSSTDGGATWTERNLSQVDLAQLGYNSYLFTDPRDGLSLYLGSRDLFKSTDGGDSWGNVTQNFYNFGQGFTFAPGTSNTHTDQHALTFSPVDPNVFYVGNDGGVSKTTNGGATFRSLNETLTLTQLVGIAINPANPAISYGGSQDNGSQQRSADSTLWREISGGDGGHLVIDPVDPAIVFLTYVRGDIFRFSNDGATFDLQIGTNATFGENVAPPRIAFYPPFVGNGVDATLYFGSWRLFTSTDLGFTWSPPAGFLDLTKGVNTNGADVLSAVAVARSNKNVIYTGSQQGRAMVSANGGRTWSDVTSGLPNRSITRIAVDPANPASAFLAVSGFGSSHVFKTTDTGATWVDISFGLPDIPANALLLDPIEPDTLYLGTDIGVFRSTSRGNLWSSFNQGMPPVVISEFSAHASGLIQAATYGRGTYELRGKVQPRINSVTSDGIKRVFIDGSGFDQPPKIVVNGEDKTSWISSSSDTSVKLKGKLKKIGLRPGSNTVQAINADGAASNIVTIQIDL